MKLAIITTHPIQYYAPVFKLLHGRGRISIMVFYTWGEKSKVKYDPGFGSTIGWDIPLLEGYPYAWLENTSPDPGTHHYKGIINPNLIHDVEQWQPDAILVFGWAWQSHLRCIRHFKGRLPVYFRGDSTLLDETAGLKSVFKTIFLRWVYSDIYCAFYTGSNNRAYFKKYGLKDKQLAFAPHAVDNERFSADRGAEAKGLREQLRINDEDILVLFAGKFEDKKSPAELLDAFMQTDQPGTHLLFVGNGKLEAELKQKARNVRKVHFMDFQNQSRMPAVLQACDLFCLPSKGPGETWGLAVNEAMACTKAVMVSDKAGCAIDLVRNGHNGAIFKSGDPVQLKDCLGHLIRSKESLREMGRNSAELIKNWSFSHITEAIEHKLEAK
ncbi:MAG TPA: glycosyltransferase family 4 protein [Mucilaginibacter sp.]|jgi:glycosyltransferase involved in cell wall biosynthesis|nr:glycosyltransferase family 4 protein [Mucilaginibacter sp.]